MSSVYQQDRFAVLSLSGGLDSTTLLAECLRLYGINHVIPVQFVYGSKHNPYEVIAVDRIIQYYFGEEGHKDRLIRIDLQQPFLRIHSNLMASGEEIPEGHYNDATMIKTVVPGRNLIFASICAGIAESLSVQHNTFADVLLGVHGGDHFIYPDCRPVFISNLADTVYQSSGGRVSVHAPFTHIDKAALVGIGIRRKVPFELTRTCYKAQEKPCGKCGSCCERIEAFRLNGITDPVAYAE